MKILYEDRQLLLAEKPAAVLSQPAPGKGADAVTLLKEQTGGEIYPVHRLDRNTGGVMVFAKTSPAAGKLSALIQEKGVTKEYLAVVEGIPEAEGEMEDLLYFDREKNKVFVVKRLRGGVRAAKLSYRRLETAETDKGSVSLVSVLLETGRTHQVRVQFASRKYPLLGDGKYGSRDNGCETALWSHRLAFSHPITGKPVEGVSPPPGAYPWSLFADKLG